MKVSYVKASLAIVCWGILMALIAFFHFSQWLETGHAVPENYRHYIVVKGATLGSVSQDLHNKGMLRWPRVWRYYAQFVEKKSIKAGEYYFEKSESPKGILHRFQRGEVLTHRITFSEGLTLREFLRIVANESKLVQTLADKEYVQKVAVIDAALSGAEENIFVKGMSDEARQSHARLEGAFFPDTYQFLLGDTDMSILRRAHEKMRTELAALWVLRSEGLPYDTPYEALIMASIVEKETGAVSERAEIAGVFVRRLQKRMRLQTDPTVIYGMGEAYDGNIRKKDLRTPTPYNTYTMHGLPPTPIAMPGREAIRAALHPTSGETLYFVAKGDGYHQFSKTLEDHTKAVRQYQLKRRKDYQSSPAN